MNEIFEDDYVDFSNKEKRQEEKVESEICPTCKYEFDFINIGCMKYNPDGKCLL